MKRGAIIGIIAGIFLLVVVVVIIGIVVEQHSKLDVDINQSDAIISPIPNLA